MNAVRVKNLLRALSNESVKRLPYILLILITLSFVQFTRLQTQTANGVRIAQDNSLDSKTLLKRVAGLAEDNKRLSTQNKDLTEQSVRIANDNAKHLDCLAALFAQYTRDQQPILAVDMVACSITTGTAPATSASDGSQPLLSNPGASPYVNNNGNKASSQPDKSQSKSIIKRLRDIINIFN